MSCCPQPLPGSSGLLRVGVGTWRWDASPLLQQTSRRNHGPSGMDQVGCDLDLYVRLIFTFLFFAFLFFCIFIFLHLRIHLGRSPGPCFKREHVWLSLCAWDGCGSCFRLVPPQHNPHVAPR